MKKAIFLDRDGTIIKDKNYLSKVEEVEFYKNTFYALKEMLKKKYLLIIITNQSGIGKDYYTEEDYFKVNEYVLKILKKNKIKITKTYYSAYYEKSKNPKYRKGEKFRKPNPGMLLAAKKEFNIDFKKSIMIGDKILDIETGKKVGCKTVLLMTGKGRGEREKIKNVIPDYICRDLKDVLKYI